MSKDKKTKKEQKKVNNHNNWGCEAPKENTSVLPLIKKKYMIVMILLILVWVFLLSFITWNALLISYIFLWLLLWWSYMMYNNLYCFQKIGFKYRPFVMTAYFKYVALAWVIGLLIYTIPMAYTSGERFPYGILRAMSASIPYQFMSMFTLARTYKKSDPTKCEFC